MPLRCLLPNGTEQLKFIWNLIKVWQQHLGCNFTKFKLKAFSAFRCVWIFPCFAKFTTEIIGNERGPLLKFVDFSKKWINKSETYQTVRKDITVALLKFLCNIFDPVKGNDKQIWLFCIKTMGKIHLISSQSLNLGGRQRTTDDVATIPFYPSLSSAALREPPNSIHGHSLMLSSYLFFCLPFLLAHFTVPCRIIFAMPEDREMWPYHLSFCFFTMVRNSSCEPPSSSHGLCRTFSEVSYSILSQGLGPFSRFLLSRSSSHRHKGRRIRWGLHQLILGSKRDVLVPPYDLQSRKSCCCLGYPGKNLRFWSFVGDDLLQGTWSSPVLLASDLLSWPLFGRHLGCLSSLLSCLDRSPFCTLWWLYRDRFFFLFCNYDNVMGKIQVGLKFFWPVYLAIFIFCNFFITKVQYWANLNCKEYNSTWDIRYHEITGVIL